MNQVQEKIFTLLTEIDSVCNSNNIDYYLCADTALFAFKTSELHRDAYSAQIAIASEDTSRFLKAMKETDERIVECWKNNENYPDFSLRYVDKKSLCFNLNDHKANKFNGIFVHIAIIRKRPSIKKKNFIIENGINFNSGAPQGRRLKKMGVTLLFKLIMLFSGKKKFVRNYFEKQISVKGKNVNQYKIGKKIYPRLILEGTKKYIKIFDQHFQTFPYLEEYFLYTYGYGWKEGAINFTEDNLILDPNISSDDFEKELAKLGWSNKKYDKSKYWLTFWNNPKVNARIRKQQLQTQDIVDTLDLKVLYRSQKKELLKLYKNQNYEILDQKLEEYYQSVESKNKMISFDRELSKIVIARIKDKKGKLYANNLESRRKSIGINIAK